MIFSSKVKERAPTTNPAASSATTRKSSSDEHGPEQGRGTSRSPTEETRSGRSNPEEISQISHAPVARPASRSSRETSVANSSTLNPHLFFEGNLKYSGTIVIDCDYRGSIVTDDTLLVGPSGKVEAEITAGVVEVSGKVRGNLKAKTRVKILSGGEVIGNIETPTISMEEGVVFEGNCTRPGEPQQPQPPKAHEQSPNKTQHGSVQKALASSLA